MQELLDEHMEVRPIAPPTLKPWLERAELWALGKCFSSLAGLGRISPLGQSNRYGVEAITNVAYAPGANADHTLDIYRPIAKAGAAAKPWPVVFHVHGGGFSLCSKDTHWLMAIQYARRGYVVVNINYRLAPRHPYPAAIEDTCAAFVWTVNNIAAYGGDVARLALAGESAGANLVTSLALALCYERPEPWARAVFRTNALPKAVLPACGLLQVSNPGRHRRRKARVPLWVEARIRQVQRNYLPQLDRAGAEAPDLADPLVALERGTPPDRPLPPFFVPVGTRDPLLDDSRRLKAALDAMGVPCTARYYPGGVHAFHAFVWHTLSRAFWSDTLDFLQAHI